MVICIFIRRGPNSLGGFYCERENTLQRCYEILKLLKCNELPRAIIVRDKW